LVDISTGYNILYCFQKRHDLTFYSVTIAMDILYPDMLEFEEFE